MFCVIYKFDVFPDAEEEFLSAWKSLTKLIAEYEGGLGSRLHKNANTYTAYAQWPDKETWKNSGSKLPEESESIRNKMRSCCKDIQTIDELEVIVDLLK